MAKRVAGMLGGAGGVEWRALSAESSVTESGVIHGLAAPFNSPTMIGDAPWGFREQISPGAFSKTLSEADVVYLVNHNPDMPLARVSAGTLSLSQSERGLEFEAQPADTTYARDLAANIRAKNVKGNSFGFQVIKDSWGVGDDGVDERTINEVRLLEVSSVTFPAYGDTEVSLRDYVTAVREARAKYNAAQLKEMLAKGQAFKNANGEPSYPIADSEDLDNAIRAVGRGGADHDAIRKYIIGRAKALGLSSKIPDTWNADGSMGDEAKSMVEVFEAAMLQVLPAMLEALPAVRAAVREILEKRNDDSSKPAETTSHDDGFDYALMHAHLARKPRD